ncbi:MAG: ATP-binding protein [Bacillota bacterium]
MFCFKSNPTGSGRKIIEEIEFDGNRMDCKKIRKHCKEIARKYLVSDERTFDYEVSVDEVLTNAIVHGYQENERKRIKITFLLEDDFLITQVRDYGVGIPNQYLLEIPAIQEEIFTERGRGLYLAKHLCDGLKIEKAEDYGTIVSVYFERMCF